MIRPIAVEARKGYRIWICFSNGSAGEVDLSHLAGRSVFEVWRNRSYLEKVRIMAVGGVAWGKDIELCPDALYLQLAGKSVSEVMPV